MRVFHFPVAFLIALNLFAQEAPRPILVSHDLVDGPLGGDRRLEDLQVFESGEIVYVEEGTTYKATIAANEMQALRALIDSAELRSLPEKVPSKIQPVDFFWQQSLQINRPNAAQKIEIANFYPFLNLRGNVYPKALIQLECRLLDIKATASNRKDDNGWCEELSNANFAETDCKQNEKQARIIADEGWGPVRLGAPQEEVEAFLGKGISGSRYSDVYFENYETKGLQVSFNNASNTIHAIYFYNGQQDDPEFASFCGEVDKEINWRSSINDVKKAFGTPIKEFSGTGPGGTWTRLAFAGIDFRFENGKMVRIGVPGN